MRAKHARRIPTSSRIGRAAIVPTVLLSALALSAPAAVAAKPTSGGSVSGSSLSVVVLTGPDQTPNYGETITFNVTSGVYYKWVDLRCYQSGTLIGGGNAGFFPEYPWAATYTLSGSAWTSGAANCSARLYTQSSNGKQSTLATLAFNVAA